MLNQKQKDFVQHALKTYGKAELTISELISANKEFGHKYEPQWITKNKHYKIGRGLFKLPNIDDTVEDTKKVVSKPKVVEENDNKVSEAAYIVSSLTGDIVPKKETTFVSFGNQPDLKSIIKSGMFYPVFITGLSGNGKTLGTRKGVTVEVGNTDAEGRLVMCDALAEADREKPELLIDCATLTGAARSALGTELPAMFCNDDDLADEFASCAMQANDPLWRLPLWRPYRRLLDSKVADINNVSDGGFAGAITAALYLQEFVAATTKWIHLDIMAWNVVAKPGRPVGGEAQAMRALFALMERRFGER